MKDCMMRYGCIWKGTGIPMQCDICPYNRAVGNEEKKEESR